MTYATHQIIDFLRGQKELFERQYQLTKIGIFGSCARGKADEQSDIDIVVELKKPDLFYMIGIKQAIEEGLGKKVDIVRLRENMNQALKSRIERDVIYVT